MKKNYLDYILNPLQLLHTQKVLHVNPTAPPQRKEPAFSSIKVHEFDKEHYQMSALAKVEDSYPFLDSNQITWIDVGGLRTSDVEKIGNYYQVHPLIMEDILSIGQRPKMDEINNLVFCQLNLLHYDEKQSIVETEQVSLLLGKNFVISFQEDALKDPWNPLREKLKIAGSKVRQQEADFLFYILIDLIVDNYYLIMEKLADKIEELEEDIIRNSNKRTLAKINILRKELIVFKRSIGPVRDLVNGILRSESEWIEERTEKYFKDVYDHIIQANDLADNYRDMMMNLQDVYLSNVNLKTNEVMKVMAVVTCLLAPATVIGGIFGMNFDKIPLLHNQWGFYISVALMLTIPIIMIYIFKKRGWF